MLIDYFLVEISYIIHLHLNLPFVTFLKPEQDYFDHDHYWLYFYARNSITNNHA